MAPDKQLTPEAAGLFLFVASLGGMAYHLWRNEPFWTKRMVGAVLLSAIFGAGIACWCWGQLHEEPTKLVAIAIAGGIGATNLVDVAAVLLTKHGDKILDIMRKK